MIAAVVDAFCTQAFAGNPAAVVLIDENAPSDLTCQAFAAEFNLSETAFIRPIAPQRYGLRWFTPLCEVSLCGHARWLQPTGYGIQVPTRGPN